MARTTATDNGIKVRCEICGGEREFVYASETVEAQAIDPSEIDRIYEASEPYGEFIDRSISEFDATHICDFVALIARANGGN